MCKTLSILIGKWSILISLLIVNGTRPIAGQDEVLASEISAATDQSISCSATTAHITDTECTLCSHCQMAGSTLTSSVSKGCFVIRPTSQSSRKRKFEDGHNCFPQVNGEREEHRLIRHMLYTNTWKEIEKKVSSLQSDLNNHVFNNILEYIRLSTSAKKV